MVIRLLRTFHRTKVRLVLVTFRKQVGLKYKSNSNFFVHQEPVQSTTFCRASIQHSCHSLSRNHRMLRCRGRSKKAVILLALVRVEIKRIEKRR